MPRHDPVPPHLKRAATAWARYKRIMRWMVLASALTVAAALIWLDSVSGPMPIHMIIATVAGVGLAMLVGTGLMGLVFLSNASGHDDAATHGEWNDDQRD